MQKILLIAEFDKFGGTRTYFNRLIQFYNAHQFQVVAVIPKAQISSFQQRENHVLRFIEIPEKKITVLKFLSHRFPFDAMFDIKNMLGLIIKEKPDIIVVSVGTPGMFLGLIVLPIRFLYILHTYPHSPEGKRLIRHKLKIKLLNFLVQPKKVILTVSNYARTEIAKTWLGDDKNLTVKVVYNTAGSSLKDVQPRIFSSNQKIVVLTLGHVTWYKNSFAWIQVAQKVLATVINKEVEFVWAGEGDQLEECRHAIAEAGLERQVKLVGLHENVKELYQSAHIYFQPSLIESQGISVIEAMRFGLPCVVSNVGGLTESVVNDVNGYVVNVNEVTIMSNKLVQLIDNQILREQMGKAGCERYNSVFADEIWERQMIAVHNDIFNKTIC